MRSLVLAMTTCLATSLWAQLPFSFSGTAGDACIPAQDPFIQSWPGTADPASSVRFAWSATNTTNAPVLLTVSVYRDAYFVGTTLFPDAVEHTFTVTAAPNTTTTGANIWPCAYNGFEQGRAHTVRVAGPAGTCTGFSITVEDSPGAFANDVEPNNASNQFITAAPNTYYEGHLRYGNTSDPDWYRIDLPTNGVLRIEFEGEQPSSSTTQTVEVRLSLTTSTIRYTTNAPLGADRVPLATNIDVSCMGSEGVYNLRFLATEGCDISYRFRYVVLPTAFPTDAEPNNGTPGSAGSPVAHDTYQDGQIGFEFQTGNDLFNIVPPFNGVMNIEVQAEHAGSAPGEMMFTLYTSAGVAIQSWNVTAGANGNPVASTFTVPCRSATTDYDIGINAITCGVSYRWKYTITPAVFANDLEPNNGSGGSTETHDTWYEGQIGFDNQTDDDIYNLVPPFNGVMSIEVEAEHAGATAGTLEVTLFTSAGSVIEQWIVPVGASGVPASTLLTRACRSSTTDYDLRFRDLTCGTSYRWRYVMTAPVFANDVEPNQSTGTAIPIDLNSAPQTGQIGFDDQTDGDWYVFSHPGGPWSATVSAEHGGIGEGSMNMVVRTLAGTTLASFSVPAGGASTPVANTFTITSLAAGSYRILLGDVTCGVSYRLHCYDDDNDGTCNAFDLCAGGPEPGTPCDDGTACTNNDVIQSDCSCAGTPVDPNDGDPCTVDTCDPILGVINTFQDSDGDGTCDANDVCANSPEPGQSCDDGNAATINDVVDSNCNCAGTLLPGDCLGIPGGSALPGTPCDDNSLCTTNDTWDANCNCVGTPVDPNDNNACTIDSCDPLLGVINTPVNPDDGDPCTVDTCDPVLGVINTFQDSDGDGTCDANDACPDGPEPGQACDDGNAATINDVVDSNCNCAGTPVSGCTEQLELNLTLDAFGNQTTWTLFEQGTNAVADQGGPYADGLPGAIITETLCLPVGCYRLMVNDAGGDGIVGGGYVLRKAGTNGQRILDNTANGDFGSVSAVIGNGGFCLPLGTDKLIYTSCDKLDWVDNQFVVASENPAVSAQFGVNNANSGYQFWWFDPNGSYGYSKFRSHATSDGFGTGATRACHARINNWSPNQIPANVLMNVKVRSRINGVNGAWGPVCRFKIDPARAACPLTKLMDIPGNANYSCGVTRTWGGSSLSKVVARPVDGATQYQFRWWNGELAAPVVRTTSSYILQLNWTPALPNGTYQVQVRTFKNGQWCATSLPWGDVCNVTITGSPASQSMALTGSGSIAEAELALFPNPNNGEQLTVSLSAVEAGVETVAVDIFDLSGARVSAQVIAVNDGLVYQVVDVAGLADGLYMVNITAGGHRYTERLVIAK